MKLERITTQYLQGIAIILMVFHHLIGFPERIMDGIELYTIVLAGQSIDVKIAIMSKLCVSIFAVVTGYGLAQKNRISFKYIISKLVRLLFIYWICELVYIALYFSSGTMVSMKNVFMNMILLESDLNYSAWYMLFYVMALITMWLVDCLFRNRWKWIWGVVLLFWGINYFLSAKGGIDIRIFHYFHYMPVVLISYCLGKSGIFDKCYERGTKSKWGILICVIGTIALFVCRIITGSELYGFCTIWIYTPILFIILAILLKKISDVGFRKSLKCLSFMGEYSTEFWLLNSMFTSGIFWIQYICFLPKYSLLVTAWAIIIMWPIAKGVRMLAQKLVLVF